MLDLALTRQQINCEMNISTTATSIEEGQFLASILEEGEQRVLPSTGAEGEQFAGIAWGYFTDPTTAPLTDTGYVDGSAYTFVLSQVPNSATAIAVYAGVESPLTGEITAGTQLTVATGTVATGQYTLSGNTLTLFSDMAKKPILVTYRYALTAQQAAFLVGDGITVTRGAQLSGTIGVIQRGRIVTSCFDTGVDWTSNPTNITLGANGLITIGGSGTKINGRVELLPSAGNAMLGIQLDSLG